MQKRGLGRGLSALLPAAAEAEPPVSAAPMEVEIDAITPNPRQPRLSFDEGKLAELAASLRERGMLQPLLVRPAGHGFELIAGERRWRAAMRAGLERVPVVVREASDHESLELALIENLQRDDLNAMEEARAYQRLREEFNWTQEEIAERIAKSRPAVANALRLLALPPEVQELVQQGKLRAGHARALAALEQPAAIIAAARQVVAQGLSTRETEMLARRLKSGKKARRSPAFTAPEIVAWVERLQQHLGTKVRIRQRAGGKQGRIEIEYYSPGDLVRIAEKLASAETQSVF